MMLSCFCLLPPIPAAAAAAAAAAAFVLPLRGSDACALMLPMRHCAMGAGALCSDCEASGRVAGGGGTGHAPSGIQLATSRIATCSSEIGAALRALTPFPSAPIATVAARIAAPIDCGVRCGAVRSSSGLSRSAARSSRKTLRDSAVRSAHSSASLSPPAASECTLSCALALAWVAASPARAAACACSTAPCISGAFSSAWISLEPLVTTVSAYFTTRLLGSLYVWQLRSSSSRSA
mmetsp:Transcript_6573/g.26784  ORF Transcript_6573/g.26784 Transcript_6573/m.26784 type:complete len:236 (-) Transcript_6573:366-1073(-)